MTGYGTTLNSTSFIPNNTTFLGFFSSDEFESESEFCAVFKVPFSL